MLTDDFLVSTPDTEEDGQLFLATVADVTDAGVSILFDGSATGTTKTYKQLNTGVTLSENDRIVVMKASGSYVVLGKIAYTNSGGGGGPESKHIIAENSPRTVSQLNNVEAKLLSVDLPAGIWLIYGAASFNTNSTGIREIAISTGNSAPIGYRAASNAVNSNPTDLTLTLPVVVSASTTYNLITYQSSGSALSLTGMLEAFWVGPAS